LNYFGLTVSDAVRMTLTRIAHDKALPLELKVPNAETEAAMAESRALMAKRQARFRDGTELLNAIDSKHR
jgi:DNA-damage-inducible protein J